MAWLGRGPCTSSASTTLISCVGRAGGSSVRPRRARDSARVMVAMPAMSRRISSYGLSGWAESSTAVLAVTPPRSSASRIAASLTASDTFGSVAMPSSSRAMRSADSARRRCAFACVCGAFPPWCVHTRPPIIAARLHRSPLLRCAVQRCAWTSGLALAHHCSLHLTTRSIAERSFMASIIPPFPAEPVPTAGAILRRRRDVCIGEPQLRAGMRAFLAQDQPGAGGPFRQVHQIGGLGRSAMGSWRLPAARRAGARTRRRLHPHGAQRRFHRGVPAADPRRRRSRSQPDRWPP